MICRILAHPVKETNQTAKRLLSLDDPHFVKRLTQRTPRLSGLLPVSRSGSQHWSTDSSARRRRRQRPYPNARIKGNCRSMNHTCQRTKVLSVTIVAIEAGIFANANHPTKSRSLCPQRWSCRREGQGDRPIGRSFQPNTLTSPFIKSLWTLRASSTVFCSTPPKRPSLGIEPASLDGNLCSRLSPHPGDQALQFRLFHQDRRLSRVPPRPFPLASFGKPRALASNLEQIDADDWVTLSLPLRNFA